MVKAKAKGRKEHAVPAAPTRYERYQLLFESSSDAIMLLDRERFFDCNRATLDMFGVTKEEFIRLHPSEISPPKQANGKNSREEADRRISEAYDKGMNKFEWIHRRRNGEDFHCTVWLTRFPLEGKQVLQATVREICHGEEAHLDLEAHRLQLQLLLDEKSEGMRKESGERKKAESEVRRLIRAVEGSFNSIVLFDIDLNIVYANRAFADLADIQLSDARGRNISEFLPKNSEEAVNSILATLDPEEERRQFDIEVRTATGRTKWVEVSASTMFDEKGEPESFLAVVNDITERRNIIRSLQDTEKEIRTMKERMEYVLGATNTGFDIIDEDFNVLYVDPEWAKKLGDYSGRKCYEYFMGRKTVCKGCAIARAITTGQKVISEEYLEKEKRHIEVHTIPMKDEAGKNIVAEFNIDITERKSMISALEKSEEKFRNLAEQSPNMIFINKGGRVVYANRMCEKVMGYSTEEFLSPGFDLMTIIHPDHRNMIKENLQKHFRGEDLPPYEYKLVTKQGGILNSIITTKIMEYDGEPAIIGIVTDTSPLKLAENRLRSAEAMLRTVLDTIPVRVFWKDRESRYLGCNMPFAKDSGFNDPNELLGKDDFSMAWHEQAKLYRKDDKSVMDTGVPKIGYEEPQTRQDSGETWVRTSKVPLKDTEGNIFGVLGTYEDITERKKVERILRESEEKYRKLMESANDAIFLADAKTGKLIDANIKACELIGRDRFEIIGMHQTELHPAEEVKKYEKIFKKHVKEGSAIHETIYIVHKDSRRIPVSISSSIFEIGGLLVNQGIFHDLTDRMAAEKALRESDERIRSIFTSMEDIVFGFDREGVFTSYQTPRDSMLYMPSEQFLGKRYSDVLPPPIVKLIDQAMKKNRKNQTMDFEYSLTIGGQERWFSAKMSPQQTDGRFGGSVAVVRDITDKKATEKALQASEQVYRSLYESTMALGENTDIYQTMEVIAEQARNMLDGECSTIYIWDSGRNVLVPYYSNAKTERDKFMAFEMPLGTGLTGSVAKNAEGAFANYNDPAAKKGYVPGTKTTVDHIQSIIAEPMMSEGNLVGVINVIAQERQFTDSDLAKLRILAKQATIAYIHARNLDQLMKSEERFRKMGESMHDGLVIVEDGITTYINERATQIFGYSMDEMKTRTHFDLVIPEDRDQLMHVLESFQGSDRMPGELEFWIQRKDGSRRYIRTRTSTIRDGAKTSQFIITTDITERKQAEDENKRKLMKYMLEDGRIYLVKEFKPTMTLEALNDLLNLDYIGLIISRTPKKDLQRWASGPFEHLWLGEQIEGEALFAKMMSSVEGMKGKTAIMIDRLDYLIFKYGFKETLGFIFRLRDQIYLKEQVAIISIDPSTLKEDELNIMQKEMNEIELRQVPRPGEELMEIAQIIYDKNSAGIKPSFSEIGEELSLSKPTFRKRVRRLISTGYAVEVTKGNRKVLELSQKGRSLFFK